MRSIVDADTPQKEEPLLKQCVSDVHIGVDSAANMDFVFDDNLFV